MQEYPDILAFFIMFVYTENIQLMPCDRRPWTFVCSWNSL